MLTREQTLAGLTEEIDAVVIGGGINGAVSTAALAAHGVKVALIEANDFAGMTSQESSNMIWGGIKYLQDYEFSLVWSLCRSRNELLQKYPNRVQEIPFFAVIGPTTPFSKFLGYLGSIAYWFFGKFKTDRPKKFNNQAIKELNPKLNLNSVKGAIQYNDAILLDNDARFVYEFVKTASTLGAKVLNYANVIDAKPTLTGWAVTVEDKLTKNKIEIKSKALINATGPYARTISDKLNIPTENRIVISKGVHLIVPKIETNNKVYSFFDDKGRLFYVLPMHDRTVIGTTDTPAADASVTVTDEDRDFLLSQVNRCLNLAAPITKSDIIAERCGVRPLVVTNAATLDKIDWISLSRKHVVELNQQLKSISIFGGKLTDCINVGHEVVDHIKKLGISIKDPASWIGEASPNIPEDFINEVSKFHPDYTNAIASELWRRHGEQSRLILDIWQEDIASAELAFPGLYFTFGELSYIAKNEHVVNADDLLRRRTPLALLRTTGEISQNSKLQKILSEVSI